MLHPRLATLSRLLDGLLKPRRRARIERHLAACPRCRARLRLLRAPALPLATSGRALGAMADAVMARLRPREWRAAQPIVGEVRAVIGAPRLAADGWEDAPACFPGMLLRQADALHAGPGARLLLALEEGGLVYVNQGTSLALRRGAAPLSLDRGELYLDVPKRRGEPLVIKTPDATLSVLGTRFALAAGDPAGDAPGTRLAVDRGRVRFENAAGHVEAGPRQAVRAATALAPPLALREAVAYARSPQAAWVAELDAAWQATGGGAAGGLFAGSILTKWLLLALLAVLVVPAYRELSRWATPAPPAATQIVESWEDPFNVAADANDLDAGASLGGAFHAHSLNPTLTLEGQPHPTLDQFDQYGPAAEMPLRSLSGLWWGAFVGATGGAFGPHEITITNLEALHQRTGPMPQSFLLFRGHALGAAADFPADYGPLNGSYAYALTAGPGERSRPVDAARGGRLLAAWDFSGGAPTFRFLVQSAGHEWFRCSTDLPMHPTGALSATGVPAESTAPDWRNPNLTQAARESLMQSFDLAQLAWERVGAEAEGNMNRLDRGGDAPLGPARPGAPDLSQVTGIGVLLTALPQSDPALLGLKLEAE